MHVFNSIEVFFNCQYLLIGPISDINERVKPSMFIWTARLAMPENILAQPNLSIILFFE